MLYGSGRSRPPSGFGLGPRSSDLRRSRCGDAALAGAGLSLGARRVLEPGMRAAVTSARDGDEMSRTRRKRNAMYWRVRFEDADGRSCASGRGVRIRSATAEATVKWRDGPVPEPGECARRDAFAEAFPVQGPFVVRDPGFFGFAGLGARRRACRSQDCAGRKWTAYPSPGRPDLQVVGHSPVTGEGIRTTFSGMTHYSTPSGSGVVAVGHAVVPRPAGPYQAIRHHRGQHRVPRPLTDNLLRELATPRLGERRPARPTWMRWARRHRPTDGGGPKRRPGVEPPVPKPCCADFRDRVCVQRQKA